jgi:hypothetical protein
LTWITWFDMNDITLMTSFPWICNESRRHSRGTYLFVVEHYKKLNRLPCRRVFAQSRDCVTSRQSAENLDVPPKITIHSLLLCSSSGVKKMPLCFTVYIFLWDRKIKSCLPWFLRAKAVLFVLLFFVRFSKANFIKIIHKNSRVPTLFWTVTQLWPLPGRVVGSVMRTGPVQNCKWDRVFSVWNFAST